MSWKAAQTLTEILSGIATAARALVDAVEAVNPDIKVACSRKTVPLTRQLSAMAVRAGGAIAHRLGLSETILVFAEHRVFLPDASLKDLAARLRREAPEKKLGIEVSAVAEACEAIKAGFETIQLEKMQPADVAAVAKFARASSANALIAVAGGVTPANARGYVEAGRRVDRVVLALHGQARRCGGEDYPRRRKLAIRSALGSSRTGLRRPASARFPSQARTYRVPRRKRISPSIS